MSIATIQLEINKTDSAITTLISNQDKTLKGLLDDLTAFRGNLITAHESSLTVLDHLAKIIVERLEAEMEDAREIRDGELTIKS